MRIYELRIKRLAVSLLPTFYRKPLLAGLVQSLVAGLNVTHAGWMKWSGEQEARLERNGQVCRLRGALNDIVDPVERRIRVEDGNGGSGKTMRLMLRETEVFTMVFTRGGTRRLTVNRRGYAGASGGADFTVAVPAELMGSEDRIVGVVDAYRLVSKRWRLEYF